MEHNSLHTIEIVSLHLRLKQLEQKGRATFNITENFKTQGLRFNER